MLSFFTGTFSQFLQNFWQNFPRAIENAAAGHKWPAGPGLDHPGLDAPASFRSRPTPPDLCKVYRLRDLPIITITTDTLYLHLKLT